MVKVTINSGVCNFTTIVTATSDDGQMVAIKLNTGCPNIAKGLDSLQEVDAFQELFCKLHETTVYKTLSPHLPHNACPVYSGILKAVEVAAGMALPVNATITIER